MPELIESYNHSPRRGNYDHAATNRAYGANDGGMAVQTALRQPSEPHSYQVPSSLRVPRPPPNNKPAHRRSDPGSPSIKEPSISGNAAQVTWQQTGPLRPGQIGAPVHRARSHDEQRVTTYGSEVPPPPLNSGSQSKPVSMYNPEQSKPSLTRAKKISFAGPRVNSYMNRARVSKQTPPAPPPLKLANNNRSNGTTEGQIKTPFPASSFDSDESDDEKKGRKFPSLSAFVGQRDSHSHSKSKAEGYRGLGGLVSRVTHRFSTEDPKRDKRVTTTTTTVDQDRYLQAARAVRQPPPGDEHNWI
ncbi:hypothetical protein PG993_001276 [Apiospora rasikravindrae]|uniref:Uncharacterized protein n=1 Tax=Apiospora rasikravindrae TaxID=990691 RepID=A0ABR1UAY2_9PEZI